MSRLLSSNSRSGSESDHQLVDSYGMAARKTDTDSDGTAPSLTENNNYLNTDGETTGGKSNTITPLDVDHAVDASADVDIKANINNIDEVML